MTIVRSSRKLLKRLGAPPAPEQADPPADNPLGEWCADIDFIDRQPFVVLMNTATGMILVLPGRAADLKNLHDMAAAQLDALLAAQGIGGVLAEAELDAWRSPPTFARNGNRSLVASLNQRKHDVRMFACSEQSAFEVALRMLEAPFSRKDLGRDYHAAADLLRACLLPAAKILPWRPPRNAT